MRKLFPLLIILLAALSACDSDDDSSSANVSGKWQATDQEQYDCTIAASNSTQTCGTFGFCITIDFKSDQTYEITRTSGGAFVSAGTYSMSGNTLSMMSAGSQSLMYQVNISGNIMTTIYNFNGTDCKTKTTYQKMN
jgi:hypothetical protein